MIIPGVSKELLCDFIKSLGTADCHMALLSKDADYGPKSGRFDGSGEVRNQGYAQGGKKLQGFSHGLDDGIAWASWNNVEWMNASIKAHGAVIYAKAWDNRVITVIDFGEEKSSSQGLFRVKMPTPGSANAIFWLA
jgi:hypothetical protein